jgi:MYXO-CTERM domain-containing protein
MLLSEMVRRWGLPVLGAALLIVGVVVIVTAPAGDPRSITGWWMSALGVVLALLWVTIVRRRQP